METIKISTSREYKVNIGKGFLNNIGEKISEIKRICRVVLISDDNVFSLYGEKVKNSLIDSGYSVCEFVVTPGENSKSFENYHRILEFCVQNSITRTDLFVALGGGVVGDLTGFAASTYLRGVDFVQIPTTLLAMVDASVGGKTAINLSSGKNLCGAFYQPIGVFADCETLDTLPAEKFNDGCAEVIKYGMVAHKDFLEFLLENDIRENLPYVIKRCVETKRDIVSRDEFEKGERKLLNFGHTIGHAVEKCSNYSVSHGSAVAIGMAIATKGAYEVGMCDEDYSHVLLPILVRNNLPTNCDFSAEELSNEALSDKKRSLDTMSLVVPEELGLCKIMKLPVEDLENFIQKGMK